MAKKKDTQLFQIFIGEYVEIMCSERVERVTVDDEGTTTHTTLPLVLNGFFLDADDEFIYLGNTADAVTQAIHRTRVFHIALSSENMDESVMEMALNALSKPDNPGDFN